MCYREWLEELRDLPFPSCDSLEGLCWWCGVIFRISRVQSTFLKLKSDRHDADPKFSKHVILRVQRAQPSKSPQQMIQSFHKIYNNVPRRGSTEWNCTRSSTVERSFLLCPRYVFHSLRQFVDLQILDDTETSQKWEDILQDEEVNNYDSNS